MFDLIAFLFSIAILSTIALSVRQSIEIRKLRKKLEELQELIEEEGG